MAQSAGWFKTRRRAVGLVFIVVIAILIWLAIALYNKRFTTVAMVTLHTDSVGSEMHKHAEVKLHGVDVGEVRDISANGEHATLKLAIQPEKVHLIPANVSAMMLPTTLFGARYVSLELPKNPVDDRLDDGSTISQDRSKDAIELEHVLENTLPTLQAVQPQKLAVTLTAVAKALQDRGTKLGDTFTDVNSYLKEMNPELPKLDHDISKLVSVVNGYADAAPDIVAALKHFTVTSKTILDQQQNLDALYATMTNASQNLDGFLSRNKGNIIHLSADSRDTLHLLGKYAPEFPCMFHALTEFEPNMDRALGKGTDEPGLHVTVHVVPSLGRYVPGKDAPAFNDHSGPHCYPTNTPFAGIALHDGSARAGGDTAADTHAATGRDGTAAHGKALGIANSPQENELVNELLAPELGTSVGSLPSWSSALVGPIYRGTEVTLK